MRHRLRFIYPSLLVILVACGDSDDDSTPAASNSSSASATAGEAGTVSLNNGASVSYTADSLATSGTIVVAVATDLDTSEALTDLGVTGNVTTQGPTISVTSSDIQTEITSPMTVQVPTTSSTGLLASYKVVFVKNIDGIFDIIPESQLTIADGLASFKTIVFGEFTYAEVDFEVTITDPNLLGIWASSCIDFGSGLYQKASYYFGYSYVIKKRTVYGSSDTSCASTPEGAMIHYATSPSYDTTAMSPTADSNTSLPAIDGGMKIDATRVKFEVYVTGDFSNILNTNSICADTSWAAGSYYNDVTASCSNYDGNDRFYYGVDVTNAALAQYFHESNYNAYGYAPPENALFTKQ